MRPKLLVEYSRLRRWWQLRWAHPCPRRKSGWKLAKEPAEIGFRTKAEAVARRRVIYDQRDTNRAGVLILDTVDGLLAEVRARRGHEMRCLYDPMNGLVGLRDVTAGDGPLSRVAVRQVIVKDLHQFWLAVGRAVGCG